MKTVLALYDNTSDAQNVLSDLRDAGFENSNISLATHSGEYSQYLNDEGYVTYDDEDVSAGEGAAVGALGGGIIGLLAGLGAMAIPGIGPVVAAGPLLGALTGAGVGAVTGGIVAGLVDMGVPEDDAEYYAEGIRRGGTLVTVHTDDARANEAAAIMNRHNPIDINQRAESWRSEGWSGYDANADWYDVDTAAAERERYSTMSSDLTRERAASADIDLDVNRTMEDQQVIPVVEEEMRVGKRTVQRGGVRVSSHVEQVPVEENVTLREETVRVERRPVDRDVTGMDLDDVDLVEGTFELTESAEELVVDKRARVVEEVVVSKDVDTHTETVRDTIRRTDVDVEQLDTVTDVDYDYGTFESYEDRYRTDFDTNYATSGYTWDQYRPAYQYGYSLGTNPSYRGRDWADVEAEARTSWERRNQGTWENFKDAVRHGWNSVANAVDRNI